MKWRKIILSIVRLIMPVLITICQSSAAVVDIPGPTGSEYFGGRVKVLPNGNIVIIDSSYTIPGGAESVGAVYLYTPGGALISKITGSSKDDRVGSYGITVLANGHFVIRSPYWKNGTASNAGAVTWASAVTGVSGVVSAENSLHLLHLP
jgi:hypothetical protein